MFFDGQINILNKLATTDQVRDWRSHAPKKAVEKTCHARILAEVFFISRRTAETAASIFLEHRSFCSSQRVIFLAQQPLMPLRLAGSSSRQAREGWVLKMNVFFVDPITVFWLIFFLSLFFFDPSIYIVF